MDLKPNCGSEKAWVWMTKADYADEEPKQEVRQYSRYDRHLCFMSVKKFSTPHFFDLEAKFGFK